MEKIIDDIIGYNWAQEQRYEPIEGSLFEAWCIAKPVNYNKEHVSFARRLKSAIKVLRGKAFAVQFFKDLTGEEKITYIKRKLKYGNKNK